MKCSYIRRPLAARAVLKFPCSAAILPVLMLVAMQNAAMVAVGEAEPASAGSGTCSNQLQHRLILRKIDGVAKDVERLEQRVAHSSQKQNELAANVTALEESVNGELNAIITSNWMLSMLMKTGLAVGAKMSEANQKLLTNELGTYLIGDLLIPTLARILSYQNYQGAYYKLESADPPLTADEASAACASVGGRLARTYGTRGESLLNVTSSGLSGSVWIAGRRQGQTDKFDFGDGVVLDASIPGTSYDLQQNWGDSEPIVGEAGRQDCLAADPEEGGRWAVTPCSSQQANYLCELVTKSPFSA